MFNYVSQVIVNANNHLKGDPSSAFHHFCTPPHITKWIGQGLSPCSSVVSNCAVCTVAMLDNAFVMYA